jgi:hypothetical protein
LDRYAVTERPSDRLATALERLAEQDEHREIERRQQHLLGEINRALEHATPTDREDVLAAPRGLRGPDELPLDKVEHLDELLAEREAEGKPRRGRLTLSAIARVAGFNYDRAWQGEQLRELGWKLRRSHPEYSVDHGFVRLPLPEKVPDLLDRHGLGD